MSAEWAASSRCPVCGHGSHSTLGFCPNMASDNECACTYVEPEKPEFVRALWPGDPVDEPLTLDRDTEAALRLELDALRRARDVALVTGSTYVIHGATS